MFSLLDPRLWLAAMLAAGVAFGGGYLKGRTDARTAAQAEMLRQSEAARETERLLNRAAAAHREQRDAELREVRNRLADALERLRNRPERLPEPARAACQGATGAELSGPDSGFLAREAARADELRAALSECQAWVETVTKSQQGSR